MKKYLFGALLLVILSTAVFSQDPKSETAIRKVLSDQVTAWNRGDLDGFMAGYWRSEKLAFVSGDTVTYGWQPTLDRYKKGYDSREKMGTLSFNILKVISLAPDAAVVLGDWKLDRKNDTPHGKFTLTFKKFKEGWRIILDHTS